MSQTPTLISDNQKIPLSKEKFSHVNGVGNFPTQSSQSGGMEVDVNHC